MAQQQPQRREGTHPHEGLTEHRGPPDAGQVVPAVIAQHTAVDQGDAGEPVGVVGRPGQTPRAAEVVQHQVGTVDVELVEDPAAEMAGVTVDGVAEAIRFVGVARSRSGRARPPGRTRRCGRSAPPVGCRTRLPCTNTTASAVSVGPAWRYGLRTPSTVTAAELTGASRSPAVISGLRARLDGPAARRSGKNHRYRLGPGFGGR